MMPRALLVAVALACPSGAQAQLMILPTTGRSGMGWSFDIGGQVARPVGEFRTNVPLAWGAGATVRHSLWRRSPLSLRADMSWLNYGNESRRVPLSATVNRVSVDMRTTNNIALVYAGPELALGAGPFHPYAHAFAGYSYFYTESAAASHHHGEFASSTNFSDYGLTTGWGAGLRIPLGTRSHNAALDMGARFTRAGTRTYLTRGDVHDQPDGSLSFTPHTTETDFWHAHVGVTFYSRRAQR